jgi:hypothetical protein
MLNFNSICKIYKDSEPIKLIRPKWVTDELVTKVKDMRSKKYKQKQICIRTGLSKDQVSRILKEAY